MLRRPGQSRYARTGVTAAAVCLAAVGAVLLFAPDEASRVLILGSDTPVVLQLLGAGLLGYAAANWIARGAALGGIYGRSVVAGNQAHLTIGTLLLVRHGVDVGGAHAGYWAFTGLYALGAGFFSYLMFFSSGLREE